MRTSTVAGGRAWFSVQSVARISLCIVCCSVLAPSLAAQDRFEVQPFVGYKWGGTTDVGPNLDAIQRLTLDSSIAYGASATFNATRHIGLEFLWNHQPTEATADLAGGGIFARKTSVHVDQFYGDFLFSFGRGSERHLDPFVLVGLGGTRIAGAGSSISKFSYALGGGVKYFFTEHLGARLQIRYAPTYLYSTSAGVWCTWYAFCFDVPNDHYLNQGDVTGGLVFRF